MEIKIRTWFTKLLQGSRNGEVIGMGSIQSPQVLMCDDLVVGPVPSYPVSFSTIFHLLCCDDLFVLGELQVFTPSQN